MEIEHTIVDAELHLYVDTRHSKICKSNRILKFSIEDFQVGEIMLHTRNISKKQKYNEYINAGYRSLTPEEFEERYSPKMLITKNGQKYFSSRMWNNFVFA